MYMCVCIWVCTFIGGQRPEKDTGGLACSNTFSLISLRQGYSLNWEQDDSQEIPVNLLFLPTVALGLLASVWPHPGFQKDTVDLNSSSHAFIANVLIY